MGLASVTDPVSATREDWQKYVDLDVGSPVRLEFEGRADIQRLSKIIASYAL